MLLQKSLKPSLLLHDNQPLLTILNMDVVSLLFTAPHFINRKEQERVKAKFSGIRHVSHEYMTRSLRVAACCLVVESLFWNFGLIMCETRAKG